MPEFRRSPGERKGHPLQYSGLGNSMDCIVLGVTKSWTRLSDFHTNKLEQNKTSPLLLFGKRLLWERSLVSSLLAANNTSFCLLVFGLVVPIWNHLLQIGAWTHVLRLELSQNLVWDLNPWGQDWNAAKTQFGTLTHNLFYFIFFIFFQFIFISWRLITLQYCSGFCHTLTWISHGVTCISHPDPPSHLPLHLIPLGLPSAPDPSTCLMHPTWAGDLFHRR